MRLIPVADESRTSPVVILKHVKKIIQDSRDGKGDSSIFSSLSVDSLTSDERKKWRIIRKKLQDSGLTLVALDKNRELITRFIAVELGPTEVTEYQEHDDSPPMVENGEETIARPASSIGQSLASNPFTDAAFEIPVEEQNTAERLSDDSSSDVSSSHAEEADPASSNTQENLLMNPSHPAGELSQPIIESDSLHKVRRKLEEPRKPPCLFVRCFLGEELDLLDAIRLPRGSSTAAERSRKFRCQRDGVQRGTKILLLGQYICTGYKICVQNYISHTVISPKITIPSLKLVGCLC